MKAVYRFNWTSLRWEWMKGPALWGMYGKPVPAIISRARRYRRKPLQR